MGAPRILLTGAAGLVGRSMLSELRSRGTDCLPTDRTAQISIPELVTGDLGDKVFLDGLFGAHTFTCVIHLAGMLLTAARQDPVRATQINIDASIRLIERARSGGVERFVFASSLGVYGGRFGSEPVDERSPAAPEGLYGAGKLYVEYAGSQMQSNAFAFSALRIATVLGEGVENSSSPWRSEIVEAARTGRNVTVEIPYAPDVLLPLAHVDDIARALADMALTDSPVKGIFNSPAETVSIAELRDIVSALNPNATIRTGTRRETGIPARMSCQKLISTVGFQPIPLREHFQRAAKPRATSSRPL